MIKMIAIIMTVIILLFVFFDSNETPDKNRKTGSSSKTDRLTELRKSIDQKIQDSSFDNAFEEIKILFDELDEKFVDSSDIELLVSIFEPLPWGFYKKLSINKKTLKNPYLRNSFNLFFQLKSFLKKDEIFWEDFITCLEFDVRPFVFISQNWFYEIALKRKQMYQSMDKKMLGIFIHMYLMDKKKVKNGIQSIKMSKATKKSLLNIYSAISAYSSYKQVRSQGDSYVVTINKKKNEIPAEFKEAIKCYHDKKMYKAMLKYIVAFIKEPGIILLEDENFRQKATDKFLSLYYKGEDNSQKIKLIVGFIHFIHRNLLEAIPILEEVSDVKLAKMAEIIMKISNQSGIDQILHNVNRSKYIMKLGAFRLRKKPVKKVIVSTKYSSKNNKTSNKQVVKLENQLEKLLIEEKNNEAIDLLKQLNKIEEKSLYLIQMGNLYEKLGMQSYSIEVLEKAVEIDPERSGLQVRLADLCYEQKDLKRAKLHYGSALFNEQDPELLKNCRERILRLNRMN